MYFYGKKKDSTFNNLPRKISLFGKVIYISIMPQGRSIRSIKSSLTFKFQKIIIKRSPGVDIGGGGTKGGGGENGGDPGQGRPVTGPQRPALLAKLQKSKTSSLEKF